MTHTHFRCSNKKKKRKEKGLKLQPYRDLRPVNFNFKRSVVTELRIERSRSCSHSHRYNRHLHRHHHFQPQPQDPTVFPELHSTLPVYQFPGPVYHDYLAEPLPDNNQEVDDLSRLFRSGIVTSGPDYQEQRGYSVPCFSRRGCKHIYRRGLFREPCGLQIWSQTG